MALPAAHILALLRQMSTELAEVDVGCTVERVPIAQLTPLQFATQYVAQNKPVIITGSINGWPALRLWDEAYLAQRAGDAHITVDLTPHGRGDSVVALQPVSYDSGNDDALGAQEEPARVFATPAEVRTDVRTFFRLLRESRPATPSEATRLVPYVQHQNSSLTEEWGFLQQDIRPGLDWADEVFRGPPDATNIWIGDERSVTSFHKDHYENLYAVVRGVKIFHLLPPCDVYRMCLRAHPAAQYVLHSARPPVERAASAEGGITGGAEPYLVTCAAGRGSDGEGRDGVPDVEEAVHVTLGTTQLALRLDEPRRTVVWSEAEPETLLDPNLPPPLVAEVGPGDVLYLPAMWYHRVSSRPLPPHDYVVAVNQWYDMAFDSRWSYFKLVEGLAAELGLLDMLPTES